MSYTVPQIAKAVTATLVAFLGTLGTALLDNSITSVEWVGIALTTVVAAGAVFAVPNATSGPADLMRH